MDLNDKPIRVKIIRVYGGNDAISMSVPCKVNLKTATNLQKGTKENPNNKSYYNKTYGDMYEMFREKHGNKRLKFFEGLRFEEKVYILNRIGEQINENKGKITIDKEELITMLDTFLSGQKKLLENNKDRCLIEPAQKLIRSTKQGADWDAGIKSIKEMAIDKNWNLFLNNETPAGTTVTIKEETIVEPEPAVEKVCKSKNNENKFDKHFETFNRTKNNPKQLLSFWNGLRFNEKVYVLNRIGIELRNQLQQIKSNDIISKEQLILLWDNFNHKIKQEEITSEKLFIDRQDAQKECLIKYLHPLMKFLQIEDLIKKSYGLKGDDLNAVLEKINKITGQEKLPAVEEIWDQTMKEIKEMPEVSDFKLYLPDYEIA